MSIEIKKIKGTLLFFFILFSLFSPHLNLMGMTIKTVYFFILLPAVFGFLIFLTNKKLQTVEFYFLLAILISLIHSLLISLFTFYADISQVVATVRGILLFFCSYFFVYFYKSIYKEYFLDILLLHILYAILFNCAVIFLLFLVPDLKPTWHSIFVLSDIQSVQASHNNYAVRLSGLVHSGFGALSVVNAVGLVIALYLYLYSSNKMIGLFKFILFAAILFFSTILVGRLGLVVMIGCIGLFFLSINSKKIFLNYLKMISLTLLGLGLVAVVFYINFGEKFVFGFLTIFDFFYKRKIRQFYQFNIEREFSTLFKLYGLAYWYW